MLHAVYLTMLVKVNLECRTGLSSGHTHVREGASVGVSSHGADLVPLSTLHRGVAGADHWAGLPRRHAGVGEQAAVVVLPHEAQHVLVATHGRGRGGAHHGAVRSCWHAHIGVGAAIVISSSGADLVTLSTLHRRNFRTLLGEEDGGGEQGRHEEGFHVGAVEIFCDVL